jgi:hypothetical protein
MDGPFTTADAGDGEVSCEKMALHPERASGTQHKTDEKRNRQKDFTVDLGGANGR